MSAVMEQTPLVDLESRAGASDKDRELWLAERAAGITATQVRDLVTGGASFRRDLIAFKLGIKTDSFSGNQYTAWGSKREPIIAAWVASRFAIADESRVFHAADNSRFLASPDGVGVGFDGTLLLSEIKTSKHDIAPGTPHFESTGYYLQMQWAMRVTGARRCLYVWEQHNDDWRDVGGNYPEPMPLDAEPRSAWFEYDAKTVAKLEKVAAGFLAEVDAARAALDAGEVADIDDELDTRAVNLLRFRAMESEAKKAKEGEWNAMLAELALRGVDFFQETALARITYTAATSTEVVSEVAVPVVDEVALRAAHPAVAKEYDAAAKALAKASERARLADEAWVALLPAFTTTTPDYDTDVVNTKAGLTVTAPKIKEMKK